MDETALDNVALRAAELPVFREIVENAPNQLEAIKRIREKLELHFTQEITQIPEPKSRQAQRPIAGLPSNNFLVAKKIFELLKQK